MDKRDLEIKCDTQAAALLWRSLESDGRMSGDVTPLTILLRIVKANLLECLLEICLDRKLCRVSLLRCPPGPHHHRPPQDRMPEGALLLMVIQYRLYQISNMALPAYELRIFPM